jgi:hypothetical protein
MFRKIDMQLEHLLTQYLFYQNLEMGFLEFMLCLHLGEESERCVKAMI